MANCISMGYGFAAGKFLFGISMVLAIPLTVIVAYFFLIAILNIISWVKRIATMTSKKL